MKSGIQGDVYVLNTKPTSFSSAEQFCQGQGGHLAAFNSLEEQLEMENYFIEKGFLLPYYHTEYLMGMKASPWPQFNWTDKYLPPLSPYNSSLYYNWGYDGMVNRTAPRKQGNTCAVANFDSILNGAWGWLDVRCADPYTFICRVHAPCSVVPPAYMAATTNATFQYFPCNLTYDKAELQCNRVGGHLASYSAMYEQKEVEKWYSGNGYLLPVNKTFYWMGLKANVTAVSSPGPEYFNWLDPTVPDLHAPTAYMHWGPSGQPDNGIPTELCAGGNFSEAYNAASGWTDFNCSLATEFMCRQIPPGPGACILRGKTNYTYCINTLPMSFDAAEAYCNTLGGHLPSYLNTDEHKEIEVNFTRMGYLIGASQQYYWMGLTGQGVGWPNFRWAARVGSGALSSAGGWLAVESHGALLAVCRLVTHAWALLRLRHPSGTSTMTRLAARPTSRGASPRAALASPTTLAPSVWWPAGPSRRAPPGPGLTWTAPLRRRWPSARYHVG